MAYRYTNTDKWNDAWFVSLKPEEKLLFNYLCDNCDIAGFIEIILHRWAGDLGYNKSTIEGALKGLRRGLTISESDDCIYINNFLKHQKNLPLNENNKAHLGIIRRFELYSSKFNIENISEFIKGASKGLSSPTGNGNGIGNGIGEGGAGGNKPSINPEEGFDTFWNDYHRITGKQKTDKDAAIKYWRKLTKTEKEKALENIFRYFNSLSDQKYCKKARTYLGDKNFNDEFESGNENRTTTPKNINDIWK